MSVAAVDEEWVKSAMTDDKMVVELLVRLNSAANPPPPPPPPHLKQWTVRQRRSNSNPRRKQQAHRASPTTPLSWSGATSFSGGSGGSGGAEESSRTPIGKISAVMRSKVNGDSEKPASKKSRKKKSLAELKDEENSLIKERRELKRELAALRTSLEKQRASNEKLKRIKIESQPVPDKETTSASKVSISSHPIPPIISGNNVRLQSSSTSNSSPQFVLPDLNMPFEEDPCPEVICGVS